MKCFLAGTCFQYCMFIIKLGGSVITKKSKFATYNKEIMQKLATEIKKAEVECLIIHGAGSFGHVLAKKHALHEGFQSATQRIGFSETQNLVQKLNSYVLESFIEAHLPVVSLSPHTMVTLNNTQLHSIQYEIFDHYINAGFTPVTYGDVALDTNLGFSICSGDLLILALASYYKPIKTIFVIDEDGLYTKNPKKYKDAEFIDMIAADKLSTLLTTLDDHADVTKGMEGKINTINEISKLKIDTVLLNGNKPHRLFNVLTDKKTTCTIVKG